MIGIFFIRECIVKKIYGLILLFILNSNLHALVTAGGYVPFGPSTQSDISGSSNALSFDPMIGVNSRILTPFYHQYFLPEFDIVFHTGERDGYSKRTYLISADFGLFLNPHLMVRYGTSTVITHISGDGEVVYLNNGSESTPFYQPNDSSLSWNQTVNLGIDGVISKEFSLRFETYIFSLFNSDARKVSYSLSFLYYLF